MLWTKYRSADINLWRLIIFSAIIIVALGIVWILAYFNSKYQQTVVMYSALWDINTASQTLIDLDICDQSSDSISISYNAINSRYTLECDLADGEVEDYRILELDDLNLHDHSSGSAVYSIPD